MIKETDLYPIVCRYLEQQGFEVKAEVKHCDVVAVRGVEPPVIVELKTTLNLELVLQAADRLKISDSVYIAFPVNAPLWRRQWRRVHHLAKRLGIGILTVNLKAKTLKARLDPAPYQPRINKKRQNHLLAEFELRVGDHNVGGSSGKTIMTAYRQRVLHCVAFLREGALPLAEIRSKTQLKNINQIFQKNHYGWFERVQRGHYQLSAKGQSAADEYCDVIAQILQARCTELKQNSEEPTAS